MRAMLLALVFAPSFSSAAMLEMAPESPAIAVPVPELKMGRLPEPSLSLPKDEESPAEDLTEAGRPFDLSRPRDPGAAAVEAPSLGGLSAAAVFTPAPAARYRTRTFQPDERTLAAPPAYFAGERGPSRSRFQRGQAGIGRMEGFSSEGAGLLRARLPSAGTAGFVPVAMAAEADVAAWSDGTTVWFHDSKGEELARFERGPGAAGHIRYLELSPNGQRAAFLIYDDVTGWAAEYVELSNGKTGRLHLGPRVHSLSVSADKIAILRREGELVLWDPGKERQSFFKLPGIYRDPRPYKPLPLAFSPDGSRIAFSDHGGEVHFLTLKADGGVGMTYVDGAKTDFTTLAWSRDGEKLAGGASDGQLRVWDLKKKEAAELPAARTAIYSVALDAAGSTLSWSDAAAIHRAEMRNGAAEMSEVKLAIDTFFTKLRRGGGMALMTAKPQSTAEVRLALLAPAVAGAPAARTGLSERERLIMIARVRRELMERTEIYEPERLVRRLMQYSTDSLEIFRVAGRKWLGYLAALGDDEALQAYAALQQMDAQSSAAHIDGRKVRRK